ncbi:hypothetical protein K4K58_011376 [Colletotrichum sp. SAR11_239]|nr:hypothetical protein K4K58_011376 [Colletotrichum sp. SAR11_239]
MSFSNDGYEWTPEGGLKTGLPTDAVIDPPKLLANPGNNFDVIVVGAGLGLLTSTKAVITGYEKFTNIDGQCGNSVYALNTSQWLDNEEFAKWDRMSCQDRLDHIQHTLTPEEHEAILGTLFSMTKGPMTRPSFGEVLRCFKTPVSRISTEANTITVTANSGISFVAQHVIVAVPLNCLKDITFDPTLPSLKAEASLQGHSNHAYKVCVEVAGKQWRNWQGHAFPDKGIPFLIGDGITPQGNSYLIATPGDYINPQQDPEKLLEALQHLHPDLEIRRIFGCDYFSDPFSKGGWAVHSPGFVMKYLKALQEPVGNIHFASADWADLWRGFIDGALESGARAVSAIHLQRALA